MRTSFWKSNRSLFLKKLKINSFNSGVLLYWPSRISSNASLLPSIFYNSLGNKFIWIKRNIKNFIYSKNFQFLKFFLILNSSSDYVRYANSNVFYLKKLYTFLKIYKVFFSNFFVDLLRFLKIKKLKKNKLIFYLFFTFKNNHRLYINIQNHKNLNFFFLSQGFFLKFFEKKKSLKKKKTFKLLLARYLRKLYLIVRFPYSVFLFKKTPTALPEILNIMNSHIIHKFNNPVNDKPVHEVKYSHNLLNILYFVFFKNTDFSKNKIKKKGRVKRKITRKLVLENSIVD